jgi:hypothetical protein
MTKRKLFKDLPMLSTFMREGGMVPLVKTGPDRAVPRMGPDHTPLLIEPRQRVKEMN